MIPALSHAQPLAGFIGGLMIGLAAAVMLLALGRIAGVSGLAARALKLSDAGPPWAEATAFVLGLPLGAWLLAATAEVAPAHFPTTPLLLVAGLIVGYGTRLGSGCTSGHGVCGLSRLSRRSLVATALFMASGFATVAAMRLLWQVLKQVVEPSSATVLAAVLAQPARFAGRNVGLVLSGGNVDLDALPWMRA